MVVCLVNVLAYGAYIPVWRLSRDEISKASSVPSAGGEKAVASWDEDSLSMAVEAGIDCLTGVNPKEVDGLFFASTSPPFREKNASSIIASALDLRKDVTTADFTNTTKAGTAALKAAVDAVKAGSAKKILVVAGECMVATPSSDLEQLYGDAAAALLVGEDEGIAKISDFFSVVEPIPGPWKRSMDVFPQRFESKLDLRYGFIKNTVEAMQGLLKKHGLSIKDFSKLTFNAPDPRGYFEIAGRMGADPKQIQDPMFKNVGLTGAVHPLFLLVAALEKAQSEEKILCAGYGDGCDAFYVETTNKIEDLKGSRRATSIYLKSKRMLPTYEEYLDFKRLREKAQPERPRASVVTYWRDEKMLLPLYGRKCGKCGAITYPIERCCFICGEKDNYEEVKIARKGKVYTFTFDYLYGPGFAYGESAALNPSIRVVADMEDGCRLFLELSDCKPDPKEVYIDMPIELTFRFMCERSNFRFYSWRGRPIRE
ncbi:MAG: hypothetical protein B6U77_01040 [Candidatus Hecatellales archaeon ex4484_218]|nr:MAG: hypothetical protein B6U77_01040 [Candidatus Hecatellales archaeon ex4484_218]